MELVEIFKDEINSISSHRPPVSKAKMAEITRRAMKATRFYKHVVMAVERFIERCSPEYKVSGLYVIDSIVRQSRHKNGTERDLFGPRFSMNLPNTFKYLFADCLPEDRPRIVRVLNIWQKNGVFAARVIQPLLDMASPNGSGGSINSTHVELDSKGSQDDLNDDGSGNGVIMGLNNNPNTLDRLQNSTNQRISKSVLDFEYDEDSDTPREEADETPTEAEPPLSSTLSKIEMEQRHGIIPSELNRPDGHNRSNLNFQRTKEQPTQEYSNLINNQNNKSNEPDPVLERWNRLMNQSGTSPATASTPQSTSTSSNQNSTIASNPMTTANIASKTSTNKSSSSTSESYQSSRDKNSSTNHDDSSGHRSKHESGHSSSPRGTKRASSPQANSSRSKSSKSNISEREAERKRKCFPAIKDRHVTVCSSTLWLGRVPKSITEPEISDAFGEFGTINSIDLIPPRGCAYVCMDRRQDAKKALSESRDLKLKNVRIKMAWAPGKGLKEYKTLKDYFEVDIGCAFIPYSKIDSNIDLDVLEEGGVIDEDSLSLDMIEAREKKSKEKTQPSTPSQVTTATAPQMVPIPALPILSQPPPFHMAPPPNPSMVMVPPPSAWVNNGPNQMMGIPFPPPNIPAPSVGLLQNQQSSSFKTSNDSKCDILDNPQPHDSPSSIDQKISITEQQISLVEQQLNLMQHSMGLPPTSLASLNPLSNIPTTMTNSMPHSQLLAHHNGPFDHNQLMFDMGNPNNINALNQMTMFPGLLGQQPGLLPIGQSNLANASMDGSVMGQFNNRY